METKELIEWLKSCAEKNCPMCEDVESCTGPSFLLRKAAEKLEELESVNMAGGLISRDALLPNGVFYVNADDPMTSLDELLNRIANAPAVDTAEVVHARWENVQDFGGGNCFGYCSNCKTEQRAQNAAALKIANRYCRWCGAKMDK